MPEIVTKRLEDWLATCPYLQNTLCSFVLIPRTVEETSRQYDLLGNCRIGSRCRFELLWELSDGNDGSANLMAFCHWVQKQSACGLAPCLGDLPEGERLRTEKGGFTLGGQVLTCTVTLVADFITAYQAQ